MQKNGFLVPVAAVLLISMLATTTDGTPLSKGISVAPEQLPDDTHVPRPEPRCGGFGWPEHNAANVVLDSTWLRRRKALAIASAKNQDWNLAVAPVTTAGNGVSETERLLIASRISAALASRNGGTVSDPYVMAGAGGEGTRVPDEATVQRVAATAGARRIYWPVLCHDTAGTLRVLFDVEELRKGVPVGRKQYGPFDVRFTSDTSPADALAALLHQGIAVPGLSAAEPPPGARETAPADDPRIPRSLLPAPGESLTALGTAYRLQLMALLLPNAARSMNTPPHVATLELLESLPAGREASLLRARTLLHLGRRLAALKALEGLQGAEPDALRALLNANAADARGFADRIEEPLPRLLTEIDLYDLNVHYELLGPRRRMERVMGVAGEPDWLFLLERRLTLEEPWDYVPPEAFAEGIADLAGALREGATEPVGPRKGLQGYAGNESDPRRLLLKRHAGHLLDAMTLANTLHGIRFRYFAQASYDRGLSLLEQARADFDGNPDYLELEFQIAAHQVDRPGMTNRVELAGHIKELSRRSSLHMQSVRATNLGFGGPESEVEVLERGKLMGTYLQDIPTTSCDFGLQKDAATERRIREYIDNTVNPAWCISAFTQHLQKHYGDTATEAFNASLESRFRDAPARFRKEVRASLYRGDVAAATAAYNRWLASGTTSIDPYMGLFDLLILEGKPTQAVDRLLSYPGYQQGSDANRISLTYAASSAGWRLYRIGEYELARKLDALATSYRTASSEDYGARSRLFLQSGDLRAYADNKLAAYNHYHRARTLKDYVQALFIMGESEKAWKIFSDTVTTPDGLALLWAGMDGRRLEGATDADMRDWFRRPEFRPDDQDSRDTLAVAAAEHFTRDRRPGPDASRFIHELEGRIELTYYDKVILGSNQHASNPFEYIDKEDSGNDTDDGQAIPSETVRYVEITSRIASKEYARACDVHRRIHPTSMLPQLEYLHPYIAYACIMAEDTATVSRLLEQRRSETGPGKLAYDYNYLLGSALVHAHEGRHDEARAAIKSALRAEWTPPAPINLRHQVLQTYDRLWQMSGEPAYRADGLDYARQSRKGEPHMAAGHAYTALWSSDRSERLDALVWTLYLDRHSDVASRIDDSLRRQAISRLAGFKPFAAKKASQPTGVPLRLAP